MKKYLAWTILIVFLLSFFIIYSPFLNYKYVVYKDNIESYKNFIDRFPDSKYSNESIFWLKIKSDNKVERFHEYMYTYSNGKYRNEVKDKIIKIADKKWNFISTSRSEVEIKKFIVKYYGSTKITNAKARLQELSNDWQWVKEQHSLKYYRNFITLFPFHPKKKWINKQIIDLEVKEISSGKYGNMPQAQPLSFGGSRVRVEVENQTRYELTVRYSSPLSSKKLIISSNSKKTVSLLPSNYKVAASVNASNVRNYYGEDSMRAGKYSSSFYINRSYSYR